MSDVSDNEWNQAIVDKMKDGGARHLIGCCGLYCGLCSKYQSKAPSRCIGCLLGEQHAWCSIWNCCVKKYRFEMCSQCSEIFNCTIFLRRKVVEWIPASDNLRQMKEIGVESWLTEQKERQALLVKLLQHYNEGRSMHFCCKVCTRMPVDLIKNAVKKTKEKIIDKKINKSDKKSKVTVLKAIFRDLASECDIDLD